MGHTDNSAKKFASSIETTNTPFEEEVRFTTQSTGFLSQKATDSYSAEAFWQYSSGHGSTAQGWNGTLRSTRDAA